MVQEDIKPQHFKAHVGGIILALARTILVPNGRQPSKDGFDDDIIDLRFQLKSINSLLLQ